MASSICYTIVCQALEALALKRTKESNVHEKEKEKQYRAASEDIAGIGLT